MKTCQWMGALVVLSGAVLAEAKDPVVHLDETFDAQPLGELRVEAPLRRVKQVSIVDGGGKVGKGKVAHFHDVSITDGGAMEYNVGSSGLGGMFIEFDLLNNAPAAPGEKAPIIFGVGPWNPSTSTLLSSHAKRAFSVEFYQTGLSQTLVLRAGPTALMRSWYDLTVPQHVRIWVNDHDQNTLSYIRPDTGVEAMIGPDSYVVWMNDELVSPETGFHMQQSVSAGNNTIGRVGFSSTTKSTVDFLIDNFQVKDPTGESVPMAVGQEKKAMVEEVTVDRMAGAETFQYRIGQDTMNLFVYKPGDWAASDRRSGLVYFFGGGWTKGTPLKSSSWARWAAEKGMVGIAPDYRTKNRFGTSPLASVADGRAAFNWVVEHADELGIDPQRIVVGGASAGGHIAMWTAIDKTPPGSNPEESPSGKPAAIFLSSAVTDTSSFTGYTPRRFGDDAEALSPVHQLDAKMPAILMFHACDDELVDYETAVSLCEKMLETGNDCELISIPRGGHGYSKAFPEWKVKVRNKVEQFLINQKILPSVS